jgi:hypothetical protein
MSTSAKFIVPALMAIGLAACTSSGNSSQASSTQPAAPPVPGPDDDKCNSRLAAQFVGQPYNDALLAKIKAAVGHDTIRVVRPNQPVTMDFREDRLNVDLNASDTVTRVHCV